MAAGDRIAAEGRGPMMFANITLFKALNAGQRNPPQAPRRKTGQEVQGSLIKGESVPGTRLCLFWERARRTECCCGMEDIAMLVFYLPFIIFAAMLEANADRRKVGAVIE
jgi:hypothetical protein